MSITYVEPPDPTGSKLVQVDSSASDLWHAIAEIDDWASDHGFVRTNEYHLRQVLVDGHGAFRGICYRPATEEADAAEEAHRQMVDRGDRLIAMSTQATDQR